MVGWLPHLRAKGISSLSLERSFACEASTHSSQMPDTSLAATCLNCAIITKKLELAGIHEPKGADAAASSRSSGDTCIASPRNGAGLRVSKAASDAGDAHRVADLAIHAHLTTDFAAKPEEAVKKQCSDPTCASAIQPCVWTRRIDAVCDNACLQSTPELYSRMRCHEMEQRGNKQEQVRTARYHSGTQAKRTRAQEGHETSPEKTIIRRLERWKDVGKTQAWLAARSSFDTSMEGPLQTTGWPMDLEPCRL